jgi:hypothetical protein
LFFGSQAFVLWTHRVPRNADQAVVGLMARHILAGKGHPVFYYGVTYAGSLEPHYVAAVFALIGSSAPAYRIAMTILLLILALGVSLLTRGVFGNRAGLFALSYFAVPPFFFLFKGLTSDGAYDAVALLALASVALALGIERSEQGRGRVWQWLLLGLVMGAGWWVLPVTAGVSLATIAWLFLRRRGPRFRHFLFLLAGTIVGSFPWWYWNLRHAWASLAAPEMGRVGLGGILWNVVKLLWVSVPVLEGGVSSTPDIRAISRVFPLSEELSLAALAILLGPSALEASRGDRVRRLLFLSLAAVLFLPAVSSRFVASEPRYAIAYYVFMPMLLGAELGGPSGTPGFRRGKIAAAAALLVVHVASVIGAPVRIGSDSADLAPVIRGLESMNVRYAYASYWTAYRLSFESGERIIASPLTGDEPVRYVPYQEEVERAPDAAAVLVGRRDRCFEAFLQEKRISYRRSQIDSFAVYSDLGPGALTSLRAGLGFPLPEKAYRARWRLGPQPATMTAGTSERVEVDVMNRGPCLWPYSVHLGYHWRPLEPGLPEIFDVPRGALSHPGFLPRPLLTGEWATISIDLVAPEAPGLYRLEYDLVHETIAWFSGKGGPTASVEVRVTPASSRSSAP